MNSRAGFESWMREALAQTEAALDAWVPGDAPAALGEASTWQRFAALRDRVEADGDALVDVRAVLGPTEADLWAHPHDPWPRIDDALVRLGV